MLIILFVYPFPFLFLSSRSPPRSYALIFLAIYPILFGPLFAETAIAYGNWAGIYVSLISSIIFIGLHRVAAGIEDPWDSCGVDDLNAYVLAETDKFMFAKQG